MTCGEIYWTDFSVLLGSQIVTIDKTRIKEKAGNVPYDIVQCVIDAVVSILG